MEKQRAGNKGILVVVSGFSGAGKGTIMRKLLSRYDNYALSVSATTRRPREGEKEGREYFFKTRQEFEEMIRDKKLIEYAQYVDNYYGTPRAYVEEQLEAGKDVILEIEIQGALTIRKGFPHSLLLFVVPPDITELVRRLHDRGTESEEVIRSRMRQAVDEAEGMEAYDYLIVNDDLERCVGQVHQIIQSEHCRMFRNEPMIRQIRQELTAWVPE